MNRIPFETDVLMPHADIQMCLNNMRRLVVRAGGKEYTGKAILYESDGTVTIEFEANEGVAPVVAEPVMKASPAPDAPKKRGRPPKEKKVGLVESLRNRDPRLAHQSVS